MRPATRIGSTIIFPGGRTIQIHWWDRILYRLGWKTAATWKPRKGHYYYS